MFGVSAARAQLISVDWNPDASPDGIVAGTLGSVGVALTCTNGPTNGGITFGTNWQTNLGSNGVPGINNPGVVNRAAALDWNAGAAGIATVTFTGGTGTDPILLFNFLDPNPETLDFDDGLTLVLLDQNPAGSVSIAPGNVVTSTGVHINTDRPATWPVFAATRSWFFSHFPTVSSAFLTVEPGSGPPCFTIRLKGSLRFFNGVLRDATVAAVPEPSPLALAVVAGAAWGAVSVGRRRRAAVGRF